MYGDMAGFLDENEEDSPLVWNPLPPTVTARPTTSRGPPVPTLLPSFTYPAFKQRTKTGDILGRKLYFQDNENSNFINVPDELIAKMTSYLHYSDLHTCRQINSRFCRIIQNNWKNLDKPALELFVIERLRRNTVTNGFLHQKATYRALLTANDFEVFHVIARKSENFWWNYQIRKAGEGDKILDDACPDMYRNVQSAPGVIDKVRTLARHVDYFWTRFKILDLALVDVGGDEMRIITSAKKKVACTIHRLTLHFDFIDLTGDHVDMINVIQGHELCIDFGFGGHIDPRLWYSPVLRITETMLIRNMAGIPHLTDNILLSLTAPKLHICSQTSITVEGIKEFIREWVAGTRNIIFICLQQDYTDVDWNKELNDFEKVPLEGTADGTTLCAPDGRKVDVTWAQYTLKLIKPKCSFNDLNPVFTYVGGRKL